ncbi:MAG: thioredoxin [Treponema sp.]|nr:thioredoxin [Treponema sp.]
MALQELNSASDFEKRVLQSEKPVIVDFWAEWCGACKVLKPIVEEVAGERSDIAVFSVNLDADGADEIAGKYNVMSLPTLLFFKQGEVVKKTIGYKSKEHLLEIVNGIA